MKNSTLTSYPKLLSTLRRHITQGQKNIERFVNYQKVVTNWQVGQVLCSQIPKGKSRLAHDQHIVPRLANDLDIDERVLYLSMQFYQTYPKLPKPSHLNWSHYRTLISIDDKQERRRLERHIRKNNLSYNKFQQFLREHRKTSTPALQKKDSHKLSTVRRALYLYRIRKVNYIDNQDGSHVIDCGFNINKVLPSDTNQKWQVGYRARSYKKNGEYTFSSTRGKTEDLYTYVAKIQRVIDGDTLVLNIDCGFGIWVDHHVRLLGIDTPEMTSYKGKEAKQFVAKALAQVSFVVVKTHQSDKYGRTLADIFYQPKQADPHIVLREGSFLNQELLDKGLAVPYLK